MPKGLMDEKKQMAMGEDPNSCHRRRFFGFSINFISLSTPFFLCPFFCCNRQTTRLISKTECKRILRLGEQLRMRQYLFERDTLIRNKKKLRKQNIYETKQ